MSIRRISFPIAVVVAALLLVGCQTKPAAVPKPEAAPVPSAQPSQAVAEAEAQPQPQAAEQPAAATTAVAAPTAAAPTAAVPTAAVPRAPAPARESSAISPEAEGFWPAPESRAREIAISVLIGNRDSLRSWKVEIGAAAGKGQALRSYGGTARDVPERLVWDGKGPGTAPAREGVYAATLFADYGGALPPVSLTSRSFYLSLSPPEPTLYANPSRLDPSPQGIKQPVVLELAARAGLAPLDSWRLDIVGPSGSLLRSYEGLWPANGAPPPISWDGRFGEGLAVEAGKRYAAILSVRDIYAHAGASQAGLLVADLPYATERSSVQPWTNGFSPNGDKVMDSMDFSLTFGQRASIRSWRLDIAKSDTGVLRSFQGSAPDLPTSLSWDGTNAAGLTAPEGRYVATLNIDYGSSFSPAAARSPSFILDISPPTLRLISSPPLFAPDLPATLSGGPAATLAIKLEASSTLAKLSDWSVEILDPGNHVFYRFAGAWPAAALSWNGIGADGSLVESAETYRLAARVTDEFGNSSMAEGQVDTDILVIKEGDRYRVDVASILFKGYTDDYEDLPADQVAQNYRTLDRLAAKFSRFPDYRIRLVGHAVMINWDDPNLGRPEQVEILVPLSRARAAAIAKALASRGIAQSRMIVEGVGANKPLVPDSDLVNRWKNRRVEFYLEK